MIAHRGKQRTWKPRLLIGTSSEISARSSCSIKVWVSSEKFDHMVFEKKIRSNTSTKTGPMHFGDNPPQGSAFCRVSFRSKSATYFNYDPNSVQRGQRQFGWTSFWTDRNRNSFLVIEHELLTTVMQKLCSIQMSPINPAINQRPCTAKHTKGDGKQNPEEKWQRIKNPDKKTA